LFGTAGAGVSWNFVPHWSVISKAFALMGPGQTNPRFQSGLRYSPTKDIDCDLIYGRNLLGEGANWITVGLTVRNRVKSQEHFPLWLFCRLYGYPCRESAP
jgi:hypothetical protein